MDNYKKIIEEAREKKINKRFGNTSIEHARILTREILLDANHYIKILTNNFNNYFYSKLLQDIINFLQKNKKNYIEIIVGKNENKKNELINELKKQFSKQIKVYYLGYDNFPIDNDTKERINFIINDNHAYRYEYSDKEINYGIVKAIANFNNQEENKILNNIFEDLKQIAQKEEINK